MYENSVVALHMILESPTTAGDRSIHSSDVSCRSVQYRDKLPTWKMEYSTTVLKSRVTMEVNSLYKSTEMKPRHCAGKHTNAFSVPILHICRS